MTSTTTPPRLRRALRIGLVSLVSLSTLATAAVDPGSASAGELPVNALADEVTSSATEALRVLDLHTVTQDPVDEALYTWNRAATAAHAARQLGYDPVEMIDAWAATDVAHQKAVLAALTQVGVPYRSNARSEGVAFDCSGLTSWAWAHGGHDLYHQSGTQISSSRRVDRADAAAGDLVHYPGHVMMYLGVGDAIVHAPRTGRTVEIDTISRDSVTFGDPTG
ncbi:C40 family peptidase [Ilumatobacter sp.]|uniref:C40 family peptidase n=1 Tax=Ilumatobacter sp. TaxID=1967498 RepID=UPI003B523450